MIDVLEQEVRSRWDQLGLEGEVPHRMDFFLNMGVSGKHGKVIYYAFRRGDPNPLFLGKIPRDGTAREFVVHEFETLKELERIAPDAVGSMFPRALLLAESGSRLSTGQTILPGIPLDRRVAALGGELKAAPVVYREAREWLDVFWKKTGLLEASEGALWEPFLRAALFYLDTERPEGPLRDEIEGLIRELENRRDSTALCGIGHGDFLVSNLIVGPDGMGAVDWEFGLRRQHPWVDPLHFVLDYSLRTGVRTGATRLAGFERGFLEEGILRELNREFLEAAFTEGGVPTDTLPVALPAYVLFSYQRMCRFFGRHYPASRAWGAIVKRCLRPGARESLQRAATRS